MRSAVLAPLAAAVLTVTVAACAPSAPEITQPPAPASSAPSSPATASSPAATAAGTSPAPESEPGKLAFEQVATLDKPVAMAVRAGDDRVYVAEQSGRLRTLGGDTVIDLSGEISTGNEQGLLGVAFHPDGRWLYLNWTDRDGHTHVTEWAFDGTKATSRRDVLKQDQPYPNHNGGHLAFGPDGYLYIGLGDGGSGGDPHGYGQKLTTWLGKILRIDPRGSPYKVPKDNPFAGRRTAKPEIWAYGLRNPWKFTFDRETGDLWIGDVGQNAWEEIDFQPASSKGGENYGWNLREGGEPFNGGQGGNLTDPVITYPQDDCTSVTAGYVYRGQKIPWLKGRFLYGDFCAGWVKAARSGKPGDAVEVGRVEQLSSFGEGADGELYAMSIQGPVYKIEAAP
ncbi:PQQ-dependent sugar dehydrogenase [Nonomuraea typhae]|uniref:PQQ-dependent sugar dehydrogenase n=1 Tax=Nonomuraea typhae TaxID=2603600 RepID=UPI001FE8BB58|nr:PQQ-dependent sugar dehydrogenase [Nonomuraea typhae]